MNPLNPTGLTGIGFVEFTSPDVERLHRLFVEFGFSLKMRAVERQVDLYEQNGMIFLLNRQPRSFAAGFASTHGPSICSMGWCFEKPLTALETAVSRGGVRADKSDYGNLGALKGIGDSLIYFCPPSAKGDLKYYETLGFSMLEKPLLVPAKGFVAIDHLTNNVEKGAMKRWSDFYKQVFAFTEVRYFDIRGAKTGLTSYALRSPDGSFCIPINEGTESRSQINEYLEEYKGPGIQHLAFLTTDILSSLKALDGTSISTLDIDDEYYREIFTRVPGVTEDREALRKRNVLIDGDAEGYLLQIFTKNLVGPIFIEIIQRKNHLSFGEGNFGALFRSIERDQMKRGYLT